MNDVNADKTHALGANGDPQGSSLEKIGESIDMVSVAKTKNLETTNETAFLRSIKSKVFHFYDNICSQCQDTLDNIAQNWGFWGGLLATLAGAYRVYRIFVPAAPNQAPPT